MVYSSDNSSDTSERESECLETMSIDYTGIDVDNTTNTDLHISREEIPENSTPVGGNSDEEQSNSDATFDIEGYFGSESNSDND